MDFSLSDEQRTLQRTFHRFAAEEIRPLAASLDAQPRFPHELFAKAGELGLFAMRYPEPDGLGLDALSYLLAIEEIAWGSLSVAASCTMQSLMGTTFVQRYAQNEVRARLLAPALRGEVIGTICMTEPDAGSDLGAISTRAELCDGVWRLSGQKTWITSAPVADMFTVFARTAEKSLSIFLVEKGAPGLSIGRAIEKSGVRASPTSEVAFDHAAATCMLGERDQGMASLRAVLCEIRLVTAALALGVARAAYEDAVAYAGQRRQFGKPIAAFQAVQFHLADMRSDLEAARRLVQWGAWKIDHASLGEDEAAMVKLFASEAALRVCERAARVLASYGYATEYPIERYLRDVRFTLIGGGTSEILRVNVAKGITASGQ